MKLRRRAITAARLLAYGDAVDLPKTLAEKPAEGAEPEVPKIKWINVANEGEWAGHPEGEFQFTRETFEAFIKQLHEDPRYKAGEDGLGNHPVIPFDFEHASELSPTDGDIPAKGVPAPAWVLDFAVRDGEDGKAQLWALAQLGPLIREYIKNDSYRHVSIAFTLDATSPESGDKIGPKISSIAFTNHPFLRDPVPIAASARHIRAQSGAVLNSWYDSAGSVEQGFEYTRRCLGLSATADATEIKAEVGKLASFAAAPDSTPPGVDLGDIFEGLRKIWGLTVTAGVPEIVAQIDKAAAQMATSLAASSAVNAAVDTAAAAAVLPANPSAPAANASTNPAASAAPSTPPETPMALSDSNKKIVKLLRVNKVAQHLLFEEDAEVEVAVESLAKDSASLAKVLAALDVEDAEKALAYLPQLMGAKAKLASVMSQLNEALQLQAEVEAAASDADVDAAAVAASLPEASHAALAAHREKLIENEITKVVDAAKLANRDAGPKELLDARKAGRRTFLSSYGVAPEGMEKLLKNIVADKGGRQLSTRTDPNAGRVEPLSGSSVKVNGRTTVNLSTMQGRNRFEKIREWVKLNVPGADKLDYNALTAKASEIYRDEENYAFDDVAA